MNHIATKIVDDKLVVTIDLAGKGELSSSGKTLLVASTHGAVAVDYATRPGLKLSLNVTAPRW